MTTVDQAPDPRAELIAGLRDLADWLEANPKVPVGRYPSIQFTYFPGNEPGADEAAESAAVDRIAALIGVEVEVSPGEGHRSALKMVGRASYKAIAIPAKAIAEHDALQSYRGSVAPEPHLAGAR